MITRITTTFACSLLLLGLAACGTAISGAPALATTTIPVGQQPSPPAPGPTPVAEGAPLRTILLAQIAAYEQALADCATAVTTATPEVPCSGTAMLAIRQRYPELDAYVTWRDAIWDCIRNGKGGFTRVNTFAYMPPTLDELRGADRLDVYVAGTPWCGVVGAH